VAIAERAWHKATWEYEMDPDEREIQKAPDWERFANTMGHKELTRLDRRDIQYAITPPGAR
jgi:hexosaminidase